LQRDSERRISDYALIGDCETAALVGRDGSIDWLCWPRFDSDACLAALLGSEENGCWSMQADDASRVSRRYVGDTLILETYIETPTGAARLIDFMPVRGRASHLIRIVVGERGSVALKSELRLRFDYGRLRPLWRRGGDREAVAVAGPHAVRLTSDEAVECPEDGGCHAEFSVQAGERRHFILTYFASCDDAPANVGAEQALAETDAFWREWTGRCCYEGPWRDAVIRSLVTMKALTCWPSGGICAAPTSSLPERFGGIRNWDYRYCWLRDATFTLLAFLHAGYREEALAWRDWLLRAVAGDPAQIQPVYGLGGEARLTEWEADWLSGFAGSRPVRFGNAAFSQRQLDVVGEVIDTLHQSHLHGLPLGEEVWRLKVRMVEHLERVWREPDQGIWESREGPQQFTYSRAMIWVALDRVIRTAERRGPEAAGVAVPIERWRALRAKLHEEICKRGFSPKLGSFVRHFDSSELDASLLLLPQVGFLPPEDPRIVGTIKAIGERLDGAGFIRRYDTEVSKDGLPSGEGAFLACSFWYADALTMIGRQAHAEAVFERLLAVRNDLGLLAEEHDPAADRMLGNFPQALSHLALVNTAFNLARAPGPAERRSSTAKPAATTPSRARQM
jgi:GH15 family glucan-1,4-alpha-glucosidase